MRRLRNLRMRSFRAATVSSVSIAAAVVALRFECYAEHDHEVAELANDKKPVSTIDVPKRLLQSRVVFLHGTITDELAKVVVQQLIYLALESSEPITLHINSPGGLVDASMAIYDTMQSISAPVHTIACGRAMSAASYLLAGGELGHRRCTPNARVMLHEPSRVITKGQTSQVLVAAEELLKTRERIELLLSKHTGKSPEEVRTMVGMQDVYLTADQALELGLIDSILQPGTPWPDIAKTSQEAGKGNDSVKVTNTTDETVTDKAAAVPPREPPVAPKVEAPVA